MLNLERYFPQTLAPSALSRVVRRLRSDGQLHRLVEAALLRLEVVVEEVDVERGLHEAREPDDPLEVVLLRRVPIDPVEQVEAAVGAERGDIVRGEVLDLSLLLQEEELRQDRDRLEIDRKGLPPRVIGSRSGRL